ncbi:MAG: purine-nucleoside phosphorylase [Erysipelotrichaceae bacterium]|nr:purine-nucleoside phosphorylase [Erysipelotrichaceae bacterium]
MNKVETKLRGCLASVRELTDFVPEVAIVLGSGLGNYAKNIDVELEIPYESIEGFPVSTVVGHDGRFILGYVGDIKVICMKGRVHYYEGYDMSDVVLPVRLMGLLGAKILFLSNAAGGTSLDLTPGDLMLIDDHIGLAPNPLIGPNLDSLGTRFPSMSYAYDPELKEIILKAADKVGVKLHRGVYCQFTGPTYETRAEVQMAIKLGASAVGMSTAVENIAAVHMGLRVCGVSCITNYAAGLKEEHLNHAEVEIAANKAASNFEKLVTESILNFKHLL